MAETTTEGKTSEGVPATGEFIQWARRLEQLAQAEVLRQIAQGLAEGCPIT